MGSNLTDNQRTCQWTFTWVYKKQAMEPRDNQARNITAVSINPGVCTFATWYSPAYRYGERCDTRNVVMDRDTNSSWGIFFQALLEGFMEISE